MIRRLDGLLQGDHRALFYGSGTDFADLREYQPQDDVRYIDWNVTARLDAPYVRQYIEDRELTAWLLLDRSSSMRFGHVDRTKETVMVEMATTIGRLLTLRRQPHRRGALRQRASSASSSRAAVACRCSGSRVTCCARRTRTGPAPTSAGCSAPGSTRFRRRSLVFVLSDFISEPGWERTLGMLAQRHEVVAIRIWDSREVGLVDAGVVVLQDAETGEQLLVDTSDPSFRRRYGDAVAARDEQLRTAIRRAGVDLYDLSTDDDLVRVLLRMVTMRKQRGHR